MKLVAEIDRKPTPLEVAEAFCELDDDGQAKVFVECARIAKTWGDTMARHLQWLEVGKHLRDCECATEAAREMIGDIMHGMQP